MNLSIHLKVVEIEKYVYLCMRMLLHISFY